MGNSIYFRHTNGCSCESVKVFETENVSTCGGLEYQPSDSCRMLEPFELSGPDICCPMFLNTGFGGIDIFLSKVNIWNVNCAWATAFIFDMLHPKVSNIALDQFTPIYFSEYSLGRLLSESWRMSASSQWWSKYRDTIRYDKKSLFIVDTIKQETIALICNTR